MVRGARFSVALLLGLSALAAHADVAPGDVVTAPERERIRGLIPPEVWPHVIEGFDALRMEIVAPRGYPVHPKYREATVRYACQASLDENGDLVHYVAGQPFPYSTWAQEATNHACDLTPDDPDFALKLAWNANHRWNGGGITMPSWGQSYWRDAGDNTWKIASGEYRRTWFSHRADLLPERTELVEGTALEWAEYSETKTPFDLRGTAFLVYRYKRSSQRADDAWTYVPTLRRVRRISTSEKADSVQGSNFTLEDFFLFSGYVWDQRWRFHGESERLALMDSKRSCYPFGPDGEESEGSQEERFFSCPFGPYRALPFVGERWEQRTLVALEQAPKRDGHPYSRKLLWYDKETFQPLFYIAYDRDGEPLRLSWYPMRWDPEHHVHVFLGSGVVDLQAGTSNLMLGYDGRVGDLGPREALRYYDVTRLKKQR